MKIVLLHCTSSGEAWLTEVLSNYQKKINPFIGFEIVNVAPKKSSRSHSDFKVESDSEAILKFIDKNDDVVLFDEKGKAIDSVKLSKELNQILLSGKKRSIWIIGGAFGVNEQVKQRANRTFSLSQLTLNHHFAASVVVEQLYRSFTILKNLPYHNP